MRFKSNAVSSGPSGPDGRRRPRRWLNPIVNQTVAELPPAKPKCCAAFSKIMRSKAPTSARPS